MKKYNLTYNGKNFNVYPCVDSIIAHFNIYEVIHPDWILFKEKYVGTEIYFISEMVQKFTNAEACAKDALARIISSKEQEKADSEKIKAFFS